MTCCVPGCLNLVQEWAVEFPRDKELVARWKASILAGTGQHFSDDRFLLGASVCKVHFEGQKSTADCYREPLIFTRNNVQVNVACCRMCLRYDSTDNMLDKDDCLVPGSSLNWLASKYFWLFQLENGVKGYFCNNCNVTVEMTDAFGQKICDAAKKYKKLLQKMAKEKIRLKSIVLPESVVRGPVPIDRRRTPESIGFPMCVIVKQEPNTTDLESEPKQEKHVESAVKLEPSFSEGEEVQEAEVEDVFVKEETQLTEEYLPVTSVLPKEMSTTVTAKTLENDSEKKQEQLKLSCYKKGVLATRTGGKGRNLPMCNICQATFIHSKEVVTHFKQVHTETELKTFNCKDCDEVFFTIGSYHFHRNYHTDTYACDQCGKKHISKRGLVRHLHVAHDVPFNEQHYVTCPICDKKVRDYNYTSHVRYHVKLGQTTENLEQKISDATKKYKKLLRKRAKASKISENSAKREEVSNDSESKDQVSTNIRTKDETTSDKVLRKKSQRTTVAQNVTTQEEPDVAEDESSVLDEVIEAEEDDIPEDVFVKEEPQLTESTQPLASNSQKRKKGRKRGAPKKSLPIRCYVCNTIFESKVSLYDHLKKEHKKQQAYECKECKMSFNKISPFNSHLARHDTERRFQCSFCTFRFNEKETLLKHESGMHGVDHSDKRKRLQCETCGKAFYAKEKLEQHVLVEHQGVELPKKIALASRGGSKRVPTCNVCQSTFNHSKEIVTHFQQVHPELDLKAFPCTDCDEVFFFIDAMLTHRTIHTGKYTCDRCGKKHHTKANLVRHLHVVHDVPFSEERYVDCEFCHKKIRDYNYLPHLRIHKGDGPAECQDCGKSFKSSFSLKQHSKRCLTGKAPASRNGGNSRNQPKCNVCQATFEHVNDVVTHFKLVHPETDLKIYHCKDCEDIFFSYQMLFRHRYVHSNRFACDVCDQSHNSTQQLDRHRRSAHGIKPGEEFFVTCQVCDHRFSRPDYRRHIRTEKHKLLALKLQTKS